MGNSSAGGVVRFALLVIAVMSGALAGMVAAAVSYPEWADPGPCRDTVRLSVAACAAPTAPGWLLVVSAVIGGAIGALVVHRATVLIMGRRHDRQVVQNTRA